MSKEEMYTEDLSFEERKEDFSPFIVQKEGKSFIKKFTDTFSNLFNCTKEETRTVYLNNRAASGKYTANRINNQKYNLLTFVPLVLLNQFKQFYNLFFLSICVAQLFPIIRIGLLVTYISPLVFILSITLFKEAVDDYKRYRRDNEINSEVYEKLDADGRFVNIKSASIQVGDIIKLEEKRRIPADMLLLRISDERGSLFIKTDQLDGETDWKLRKSIPKIQVITSMERLSQVNARVRVPAPNKDIYRFQGTFFIRENGLESLSALELENTLWANTVLANGHALGLVIYTGCDTKAQLNERDPRTKTGKVDNEISKMSFLLFILLMSAALGIMILHGFKKNWYIMLMKYILLLSNIIPIGLRVNLDLAKIWYSWCISSDSKIPGTIARNTTIPEELGRVQMLFSDKTGTLTQNNMKLKSFYVSDGRFDKKDEADIIHGILQEQFKVDTAPMFKPSASYRTQRGNLVMYGMRE
jgi:phospholipid-translocating ATPase